MRTMFYLCERLITLNLSSFDTSNVTDMQNIFAYCEILNGLDLRGFVFDKVVSFKYMFSYLIWDLKNTVKDIASLDWILTNDNDYSSAWTEQNFTKFS